MDPPPSRPPQGTPEEIKQVDLWKKHIAWEKSNPLRIEDPTVLTKRVMSAYRQCLLCLGHNPHIWHEAALFLEQSSKLLTEKGDLEAGKLYEDKAEMAYEAATTSFFKENPILHFAYADFEERRMNYDKVHQIYNKFLGNPEVDPTLAYIQYMKFARRAEGIKSAREIFIKSCLKPRTRYQVLVAFAWMEYYCSKDKTVGQIIFELGLLKFGYNPDYLLSYIDYLSYLNDESHSRSLFERLISSGSLPPERQFEIWNKFFEFELNMGDLSSILKVKKRRATVIEKFKDFKGNEYLYAAEMYKFQDLYPCTISELQSIGYKDTYSEDGSKDRKSPFAIPDVLQMIPFKPRQIYPTAAHPVPGGVFPPPPSASFLMTALPPPTSFQGPFVKVDDLIKIIEHWRLPENAPIFNEISYMEKYFEHAINTMNK